MKLALIVPGGFGGPDDVIPALRALTAELSRRHEVHVFEVFSGSGVSGDRALAGAQVHLLPMTPLADAPGLPRGALVLGRSWRGLMHHVRAASSSAPFDVMHAFWANETGLLGGLVGRSMKLPVVLSVGGGEAVWIPKIGYGGAGTFVGRSILRMAFRLADGITVGTAFARSFLKGPTAGRARIIPLGVACSRFDAPPPRTAGPPWRLLHVANLNLVKDQGTLLRAFAEVVTRLRDVRLDCVGEDTLRGHVQSQARMLGLAAHVRFHGFVPPDDLVPLYRSAHLHVLSSLYESQAVVVLEAAAAGVPTVGTAVGLLPTLSPEGAACVPLGDAPALADAICDLLVDEAKRLAMGATAQKFARDHDVVWTARAFEQTYEILARS